MNPHHNSILVKVASSKKVTSNLVVNEGAKILIINPGTPDLIHKLLSTYGLNTYIVCVEKHKELRKELEKVSKKFSNVKILAYQKSLPLIKQFFSHIILIEELNYKKNKVNYINNLTKYLAPKGTMIFGSWAPKGFIQWMKSVDWKIFYNYNTLDESKYRKLFKESKLKYFSLKEYSMLKSEFLLVKAKKKRK